MKKVFGTLVAAMAMALSSAAYASTILYEETGTSALGYYSLELPGAGDYRIEITTSAPVYMEALLDWTSHWDYFVAPPPKPHSEYIEGNSYPVSDYRVGVMTSLIWDISLSESYRYFYASAMYEEFGIPAGTLLYEWTRPEDILLSLGFDHDEGLGAPVDYTFRVTQISAVPEASTWALIIIGFVGVGGAIRAIPRSIGAA